MYEDLALIVFCDVRVIYVNKLFTTQRKPSPSGAFRLFFYSFDIICKSTYIVTCILCFKEITKEYERFFVQS